MAALIWLGYAVFLAASLPSGIVFGVTADNVYFRGGHFHVYVFMFAVSIVYLAVATAAILTTKDLADQNMYQFKKARKASQDKLK